MITTFLLFGLGTVLSAIFSAFLPIVSISTIPIVGSSIYNAMAWGMGVWNAFLLTVPYAQLPWRIVLYVILPFELILLLVKVFLGSRVPVHNTQH